MDGCLDVAFSRNAFWKLEHVSTSKRVGGKDREEGERNRRKFDEPYIHISRIKDMTSKDWIEKHFGFTSDVILTSDRDIV